MAASSRSRLASRGSVSAIEERQRRGQVEPIVTKRN